MLVENAPKALFGFDRLSRLVGGRCLPHEDVAVLLPGCCAHEQQYRPYFGAEVPSTPLPSHHQSERFSE
jgi:hypothetical protein